MYTDRHDDSFGTLEPERAEALMWVWRQRYEELGARADVEYVMIFENRGVEVGVTLHHPHGQIYGYPFLPPVPRLELAADARLGGCAPCALLRRELEDGRRIVYENEGVVAYVPYAARWPYEAHVVMREHRPSLLDCDAEELRLLAEGLQALARGYDALFDRPFPYVMVVHQAPTGGACARGRGTCTSSSIRRCAPRRSSSTSPAPSRARARSSPTCCPRSPPRCWARRSCVRVSRAGGVGAVWRLGAPVSAAAAFAPGRVNLIGEHTDYNLGLALPFAIAEGVVVRAQAAEPDSPDARRIYAHARDLGESDEFELAEISPAEGWRAFVRGVAAELARAGYRAGGGAPGDRRRPRAGRRPVLFGRARGRPVPGPRGACLRAPMGRQLRRTPAGLRRPTAPAGR